MRWLYTAGIYLYYLGIRIAAWFQPKARKWIEGRRNQFEELAAVSDKVKGGLWVHCASLGEFEQGRPVIEAFRKEHPETPIVLTFFSPSGYEVRSQYDQVDLVCYLPADLPNRVNQFLDLIQPQHALFVKYEFWFNYLAALRKRRINTYLISGIFRKDQHFFKWYGGWFRKQLRSFNHFFLQDESSVELLTEIGYTNSTVSGDTRFDRVAMLARHAGRMPMIEAFSEEAPVLVGGSTWPEDERLLLSFAQQAEKPMKLIIAPHEVDRDHIDQIMDRCTLPAIRYSEATIENVRGKKVLVIDNIGMLSSLYRHADVALIGGGFGRGIHNILEAATFGKPILFGPNYKKFKEARDLVSRRGAMVIKSQIVLNKLLEEWLNEDPEWSRRGQTCAEYVNEMQGATTIILEHLSKD